MSGTPLLVLIGPPGVGKSTVAVAVADVLGAPLRDTDSDVENTVGRPISEIFVEEGEQTFRAAEAAAVADALAADGAVVCLGGGAVMTPSVDEGVTRAAEQGAKVVMLDVGIADAARRIGLNQSRPLLAVNPRASWIAMMQERRPTYERLATDVVDTADRSVEDVVADVLATLGQGS
ncbi:AAA family ATPase [Janibacter sp. YIM B02568]|uniref:shikimate kinase n=1 Tax=Janibacter endophyticus TaxID=2806261 RepID=UPI00194F33E8|nr:shikimate kinase [Janibacter endophyticus]MBM6546555.1 AAA family ATPase [Janibacter endophyticus]